MSLHTYRLPGSFTLEEGGSLPDVEIGYHTFGTLNANGSNAIFVAHALSGSSDVTLWWPGFFEPGRFLDPAEHFIICANNLGSPYGTTSPISIDPVTGRKYGLDFPFFTIRDTAQLHLRLLEHLGIERLYHLIGPSCGGHIAEEMAIVLGDRVEHLTLLCCAAREAPWVVAIHESQRQALAADQTFGQPDGGRAGLAAARGIALPYYRTADLLNMRQEEDDNHRLRDFKASSYIRYQGQKFVERFDPYCYYHLMNALDTHNIGRGFESIPAALSRIRAKTVCMSFSSDILVPTAEQRYLAEHIPGARHVVIESVYGHDSFLIEIEKINQAITDHLNQDV